MGSKRAEKHKGATGSLRAHGERLTLVLLSVTPCNRNTNLVAIRREKGSSPPRRRNCFAWAAAVGQRHLRCGCTVAKQELGGQPRWQRTAWSGPEGLGEREGAGDELVWNRVQKLGTSTEVRTPPALPSHGHFFGKTLGKAPSDDLLT